MNERCSETVGLICVTVTFNPDIDVLARQLATLPADSLKIWVDNHSSADMVAAMRALIDGRQDIHLVCNSENMGLAAALNLGVHAGYELRPGARFALLLDQDSEPLEGSIEILLQGFLALEAQGVSIGCAGPKLLDPQTGLQHGFHQQIGWRWHREFPVDGDARPISCANLNGSGTLMPVEIFRSLGGLDESFFIDHVDTEWSFRVLAAGYTLWGIPQAGFIHRMGQNSTRFWFLGWRIWPQRSPLRHFYLFRNATRLLRKPYVPHTWKGWAIVKLAMTATVHALFDPQRYAQWKNMLRGVREGLR